jgi:hypothetical protein
LIEILEWRDEAPQNIDPWYFLIILSAIEVFIILTALLWYLGKISGDI